MIEGASIDVPVVFAPNTMGLKQAWICITMKPRSSLGNSRTCSTSSMKRVYVSHYLSSRFIFLSSRLSAYSFLLSLFPDRFLHTLSLQIR